MDRKLLMIPGPIEFEADVLNAMGWKTESHVAPAFIERFGRVLQALRELFRAPDGQPFVVAGSGTLAMEMVAANLVETGDSVLVVNTGYFSDRYVRMLERYGAVVEQVRAPIGEAPPVEKVAGALENGSFKMLVATHVDTSTGVRVDAKALAGLARAHGVLSIFDGVCATAGERFEQTEWGADVYLTASQKAIGVPPGLAILMASPPAIDVWESRQEPVRSLYLDWSEWRPIMRAYEEGRPSYFGTPPVNLIYALDVSVGHILDEGMEAVWARHERVAAAFRAAWQALGLNMIPASSEIAANTMSALYYPEGVDAGLLGYIKAQGAILAGGLHPEVKARYFRVGHMGPVAPNDALATIGAIERGLREAGAVVELGVGVAAAQRVLGD